jgi:hypothetical protein
VACSANLPGCFCAAARAITYFEGLANRNPQAKRGHSRDHRPDCKQVCIALVVTREGVPFGYDVFDGNRGGRHSWLRRRRRGLGHRQRHRR